MTPEEVQKLLDEQRAQILAEVDSRIAAAIKADKNRTAMKIAYDQLQNGFYAPENKDALNASIERLRGIVPEKDWPENWK